MIIKQMVRLILINHENFIYDFFIKFLVCYYLYVIGIIIGNNCNLVECFIFVFTFV
jgi:hypothetical protein